MNQARQLETWCCLVHDQPIEAADEEALLLHLAGDVGLREEILADHYVLGALRMVGHSRRDGAAFVQRTLARVGQLAGDRKSVPAGTEGVNEVWSLAGHLHPLTSRRKQQHDWTTTVLAVAAVVAFAMLAVVWHATRGKPVNNAPAVPDVALEPSPARGEQPKEKEVQKAAKPEPPAIREQRKDKLAGNIAKPEAPQGPPPRPTAPVIARLVETKDCQWKATTPAEDLVAGPLELLSGKAVIAFTEGPTVEITGPCTIDLRSPTAAFLRAGHLRSDSGNQPSRFLLETPTTTLTDHGMRADVRVTADGATDVLVYQGEMLLESRALDGTPTDRCRIGMGGHKHVEPLARAAKPLRRDSFKGLLGVNGEVREFTSAEEYESARRRIMEELDKFREQLPRNFVPGLPNGMKGRIEINGQKSEITSPEALLELQRKLLEQLGMASPAMGGGKRDFKGQVNVNGKQFDFNSPQSMDELFRRLTQSMQSGNRSGSRQPNR